MTLRWLIGSLLLAVVLAGCIVVPAFPVGVGRPHYNRHHYHHGYGHHGNYGHHGYRR
jgi:hypothetical protein